MWDEIYYRIYYYNREDHITVVTLQEFDECDYIQENFLSDEHGNKLKFQTEELAIGWLNDNVKPEKIDSEYRRNKPEWKNYLI